MIMFTESDVALLFLQGVSKLKEATDQTQIIQFSVNKYSAEGTLHFVSPRKSHFLSGRCHVLYDL